MVDMTADKRIVDDSERSDTRRLHVKEQLERFIVRLRIIAAHSLAQDRERLVEECEPQLNLRVKRSDDGTAAYVVDPIEFLPVEQVESAIARVRPLLLDNDGISYRSVFRALGESLPLGDRDEAKFYRKEFEEFDPDFPRGRPKVPYTQGEPISNTRIAGSWLYGDLVHADAVRQSYTKPLSFESVFAEAQRVTCGLVLSALHTLDFVERLSTEGKIDVDADIFVQEVTLTAVSWAPQIAEVYVAEEGAKMPTSVDEPLPKEWRSLLDDLEGRGSTSA